MGRRNWLNSGSHDAAQNIAFMYSLYESCKMNDIDFGEYVEDILTRIYKLLTNSLDRISLAKRNGDSGYSVCMQVPMPGVIPLLSITKELLEVNNDFVNMMIDIYNE